MADEVMNDAGADGAADTTVSDEAAAQEAPEGEDAGGDGHADAGGQGDDAAGQGAGDAGDGDGDRDAAMEAGEGGGDEAVVEGDAEAADMPAQEKAKEVECDAPDDDRARVAASNVGWNLADATLNVMPTAGGRLIMSLSDGGFQYLLAGTRTKVGVKAGRYMFEFKIIESLNPVEPQQPRGSQGRTPQPKALIRIGVSLGGSSLFLADTCDNTCFDSEGYMVHDKKRSKVSQKFGRDHVVALLLNLDQDSPNANTISLFRDGVRISDPQPLPENLRGKALYPTITYRNVTVHANFGPVALMPLPFKCRTLGDAAQADVEVAPGAGEPDGGRYEVLFPVGMPDQGYFDWVDHFLERNPSYTELSDRKILEWAGKSGVWRPKAQNQSSTASSDKPDMKFGIPLMDDLSIGQLLATVAPVLRRNFVVPELRYNLMAAERKEALRRFSAADFRRTVTVLVGEPPDEYKERVQALLLEEKKTKAEAEKEKKEREEERQRLLEEKRKHAEDAKRAKEAARRKKAGEEVKEETTEEKSEEKKEESKTDGSEGVDGEKATGIEAEQKVEDVDMKTEPVTMELTEEEKKLWYRKSSVPDIEEKVLAKSYSDFSLPTKDEGFDSISYAWAPEEKGAAMLKAWILEMKLMHPVDSLRPGERFKERWTTWQKSVQEWRKRHSDWKDPVKRKAMQHTVKGEDGEESTTKAMDINVDDLDVLKVEDVNDLGNGQPLFSEFVYEDWALLSIRFELHLLLHSFRRDLNDPERPSFNEAHLPFYYNKYFRKQFTLKNFSCSEIREFIELVQETIGFDEEKGFFTTLLEEETPDANFVKYAEEHRRERQRRIDAGDETAQLKFVRPAPPPPRQQAPDSGSSRSGASAGGSSRNTPRPPPPRSSSRDDRGVIPRSSAPQSRRPPPPPQQSSRHSYGSRDSYGGSSSRPSSGARLPSGEIARPGSSTRSGYYGPSSGGSGSDRGSSRPPPPASSAQKRPYPAGDKSSYPPPQRPRTTSSSYGGGGGGYQDYGYGSYHRR